MHSVRQNLVRFEATSPDSTALPRGPSPVRSSPVQGTSPSSTAEKPARAHTHHISITRLSLLKHLRRAGRRYRFLRPHDGEDPRGGHKLLVVQPCLLQGQKRREPCVPSASALPGLGCPAAAVGWVGRREPGSVPREWSRLRAA